MLVGGGGRLVEGGAGYTEDGMFTLQLMHPQAAWGQRSFVYLRRMRVCLWREGEGVFVAGGVRVCLWREGEGMFVDGDECMFVAGRMRACLWREGEGVFVAGGVRVCLWQEG